MVALRGDPPGGRTRRRHDGRYAAPRRIRLRLGSGARPSAGGTFRISVAAYPEGHPESGTVEADLENLKRKIEPARAAPSRSFSSIRMCSCATGIDGGEMASARASCLESCPSRAFRNCCASPSVRRLDTGLAAPPLRGPRRRRGYAPHDRRPPRHRAGPAPAPRGGRRVPFLYVEPRQLIVCDLPCTRS